MNDRLLSPSETTEILGVTERHLASMRYEGIGPAHIKVTHKVVRYRQSDLDAWIESRTRQQSSRAV